MAKKATKQTDGQPRTSTGARRNAPSATRRHPDGNPRQPTMLPHDQIAERAQAIWQAKGCPIGMDEANWYEAEVQLRMERKTGSA